MSHRVSQRIVETLRHEAGKKSFRGKKNEKGSPPIKEVFFKSCQPESRTIWMLLPFRVVIYSILPFHVHSVFFHFSLYDYGYDLKELFGYFQKDKFRKIFQVFQSLQIRSSRYRYDVSEQDSRSESVYKTVMWWTKLRYLKLLSPEFDVILHIFSNSRKMTALETLEVEYRFEIDQDSIDCIDLMWTSYKNSERARFPRLKNLRIVQKHLDFEDTDELGEIGSLWHICTHPFATISTLSVLWKDAGLRNVDFFKRHKDNFSKNLTHLELRGVDLSEETTLKVPRLKHLKMKNCFDLYVLCGEDLREIRLSGVDGKVLMEIIRYSKNFETLHLTRINWYDKGEWFDDEKFNPMKHLRKICLKEEVIPESFANRWTQQLRNQVREVTMNVILPIYNENVVTLYFHPLPKIEKLSLRTINLAIEHAVYLTSSVCSYLKELEIAICLLNEDIFRNHEYTHLESLSLKDIHEATIVTGKGWKPLPKLKVLSLSLIEGFKDDFFIEQELALQCLEKLSLQYIDCTGIGWDNNNKKFGNLKKLSVSFCREMKDDLFREFDLPRIRKVYLEENPKFTGLGWRRLGEELKILEIQQCREFCKGWKGWERGKVYFQFYEYREDFEEEDEGDDEEEEEEEEEEGEDDDDDYFEFTDDDEEEEEEEEGMRIRE